MNTKWQLSHRMEVTPSLVHGDRHVVGTLDGEDFFLPIKVLEQAPSPPLQLRPGLSVSKHTVGTRTWHVISDGESAHQLPEGWIV